MFAEQCAAMNWLLRNFSITYNCCMIVFVLCFIFNLDKQHVTFSKDRADVQIINGAIAPETTCAPVRPKYTRKKKVRDVTLKKSTAG